MLVLAHRGHHVEHPENTLAAFEAAVNLGADGIETDVQVTRDNVAVLFHDTVIQGQAGGEPTDDMREYQWAVESGYTGSPMDFLTESRRAGATASRQ